MDDFGAILVTIVAILGITGTILGYFRGINANKKAFMEAAASAQKNALDSAEEKGKMEVTLDFIKEKVIVVADSMEKNNDYTKTYRIGCEKRFDSVEKDNAKIMEIAKSAHKRLDEHIGVIPKEGG